MRIPRTIILLLFCSLTAMAQVGSYRHVFAIGVNGGYSLNTVGFQPEVTQNMYGGMTFGVMGRYTSEKYFSTICSLQLEVNITHTGWKQDIKTLAGNRVANPETGTAEEYQRNLTYIQIPILAHLAWGKERNGINFFFNAGPQFGILLKDNTEKNYTTPYTAENFPDTYVAGQVRASTVTAQENMPVENKFDYGITFGAGVEWDINRLGRLSLEGRYYYGLGNLYGDSKKDEFSKSNHGIIYFRLAYMHDI